jgi:hypothetical protein
MRVPIMRWIAIAVVTLAAAIGVFALGRASVGRAAEHRALANGHTAGENDVFAGYDGGWGIGTPYAVILAVGDGPNAYRIASRTPFQLGTDYYLCANGISLCQQARP